MAAGLEEAAVSLRQAQLAEEDDERHAEVLRPTRRSCRGGVLWKVGAAHSPSGRSSVIPRKEAPIAGEGT
jgi:hypothetical protein